MLQERSEERPPSRSPHIIGDDPDDDMSPEDVVQAVFPQYSRVPQAGRFKPVLDSSQRGPSLNRRRMVFDVVSSAKKDYVENGAAVKIQSLWRAYSTRHNVQRAVRSIANSTATRVQSLFRRHRVKKETGRREKAAIQIQACWRTTMGKYIRWRYIKAMLFFGRLFFGLKVRANMSTQKRAAMIFQKIARSFLLRKLTGRKQKAAVIVQRWVRGLLARLKINTWGKAVQKISAARRASNLRYKIAHRAQMAYKIQFFVRAVARIERQKVRRNAAGKIAGVWKGYVIRKRNVERCFQKLQAAVIGKYRRKTFLKWGPMARRVQAAWRGYMLRFRFAVRFALAIALQRHARRQLTRSRARAQVARC
jgi:hypothetical protein